MLLKYNYYYCCVVLKHKHDFYVIMHQFIFNTIRLALHSHRERFVPPTRAFPHKVTEHLCVL